MALQPLWNLVVFQFLNLYTVGRNPWTEDQPVARPLPAHRTTQTHNKRTQTSMPQVGLEPTIPVFEQAKTVHALGCAPIVIGFSICTFPQRYTNERVTVIIQKVKVSLDRLCGLVVEVPGYRSRGPGSISGATRFFLRSRGSGTGSTHPREDN
jgi:hypothetical protein